MALSILLLQRAAAAAAAAPAWSSNAGLAAPTARCAARAATGSIHGSSSLHSWSVPGPLQQGPTVVGESRPSSPDQEDPTTSGSGSGRWLPPFHGFGGGGGHGLPGGGSSEDPMVCGHPKDKISKHRAANRRRIYYRKPQGLLAFCKFCQSAGGPHTHMQGSGRCTGRCLDGSAQGSYPREYKAPV
jgi:hypothetical protein